MRPTHFAPLPRDVAAALYTSLEGEEDWRLTLPYWPDEKRAGALVIWSLLRELEGVPARVSEAMIGRIRCQWWRDAIEEAFGDGAVRAHPLAQSIERVLAIEPAMREPLLAMVDGAEAILDWPAPTTLPDGGALADGLWGGAGRAASLWLKQEGASEAAASVASAHAVLRLAGQGEKRGATRSLPRASDRLAAIGRDGQTNEDAAAMASGAMAAARDVEADALPVVLPAVLLGDFARQRRPSGLAKRWRYFAAMARSRM